MRRKSSPADTRVVSSALCPLAAVGDNGKIRYSIFPCRRCDGDSAADLQLERSEVDSTNFFSTKGPGSVAMTF